MFRGPFLFLGERLAVDLLNTVLVLDGEVKDLLLEAGSAGAWAEAAGVLPHGAAPAHARGLPAFREALRRGLIAWAVTGVPSRALVAVLNRRLAHDPAVDELKLLARKVSVRRRGTAAAFDHLYGAVAHSAADLLLHGDPNRLRKCANPACRLMFYDVSKAGRRRWCSMLTCGARAKSRAYRERRR